ncbi:MAG: deoxyribodipyrimidine photo-lyase [Pseudomonadota bacterium]
MQDKPHIVWLRRDLRLADNPALTGACASGAPVAIVYIFDEDEPFAPGGAAKWWLHHSLRALDEALDDIGASLTLRRGSAKSVLTDLAAEIGAGAVHWNRRYAPSQIAVDKEIKETLADRGIETTSYNGALLREPWELKTGAGGHFKVFTPFWKNLRAAGPARAKSEKPPKKISQPKIKPKSDRLESWALTPSNPNWAEEFPNIWTPGEAGASEKLDAFLSADVSRYDDERNRPDLDTTSRLSPHLAFGEVSPLQVWEKTHSAIDNGARADSAATFLSEIAWREFSYLLLYHYDGLNSIPIKPAFESFPWRGDKADLRAWTRGQTGYPIVDAGMRQLWRTGWMHNRVRMIVASFLVKHLLLPWQEGEKWFWDTLVDADPASNAASWQWTAGCGADAAPYFRIFNPITQGEKFDPDGAYTRLYVPEVSGLPNKYLQKPWDAPEKFTRHAGVTLGENYPGPLVDHPKARVRALDAFEHTKKK